MKKLFVLLLFLVISACNENTDGTQTSRDTSENTKTAKINSADTQVSMDIDLNNLPQSVTTELDLDSSVEPGDDAFGVIIIGGKNILVSVSEDVASSASIDTSKAFTGKVTVTVSAEHKASNDFIKVYSITKIEK
ncbi:MAG: hypothetical protein ACN4GR_01575 [Arenicellales bacterium]